ncbi:MAG: M28 family metallopeptidase [Bdellovibrionota bacterium]
MLKLILLACLALSSTAWATGRYGLAPLSSLGPIRTWASENPDRYWLAGEDNVFYFDPQTHLGHLPFGSGNWRQLEGQLYLYYGAHPLPVKSREILSGGRVRLIESAEQLAIDFHSDQHGGIRPVQRNQVLVQEQPKNYFYRGTLSLSAAMDFDQWFKDVETLSKWNRYTYGTEIDLARSWLIQQFSSIEGLNVQSYPFLMPSGESSNVIATLKGRSRPEDVYIIGAHYDSTSQKPSTTAPGAEDNASGVAGLLSLARVFADHPPEATLIFIAFSGEEQGLYGSKAWLKNEWLKTGIQSQIKAVMIMDMIGYSGDDEQDVLLETSSLTKPLLADIQSVNYDRELIVSESFNYWGSDHEPFLDNDVPAILFIEDDYLRYPNYHRTTDTFENIHPTLGPKILTLIADSLTLWVFKPSQPQPTSLQNLHSPIP